MSPKTPKIDPKTVLSAASPYMCVKYRVLILLTDTLTSADSCIDRVFINEHFMFLFTHIYRERADSSVFALNCQQVHGVFADSCRRPE
jgi:hypothetical protein